MTRFRLKFQTEMVCYGYSCLKEILLERSCVQIHGLRIKLKTDREQDAASLVPKKSDDIPSIVFELDVEDLSSSTRRFTHIVGQQSSSTPLLWPNSTCWLLSLFGFLSLLLNSTRSRQALASSISVRPQTTPNSPTPHTSQSNHCSAILSDFTEFGQITPGNSMKWVGHFSYHHW